MLSNNGWKIHYQPVTDVLSGSYTAYDLGQLSTPYSCTGRKDYIDGIVFDGKNLTPTPTWDVYTDKDFNKESAGNQTFENWKKTFTPFMDVERRRIAVTSKTIEAGSSFKHDEEDLMMAGANPESDVGRYIISSFKKSDNSMFLNALASQSVQVSKVTKSGNDYEDIESAEAIPDSQKYTTKNAGYIDIDDFASLQAKTAINMTNNEQWFLLCSPTQKEKMIQNNIDYIFSKDFVSMGGSLENGTLPKIMDFIVIPHPDMEAEAYANKFFCFTKGAIAKAVFSDLKLNVGESADRRFQKILYYSKKLDYKCKDWGKLIQGTIKSA